MSGATPTEAEVRAAWRRLYNKPGNPERRAVLDAKFDRFISSVEAKALREAADDYDPKRHDLVASEQVRPWLRDRADRLSPLTREARRD